MKTLVIYDSPFGNTKLVAETIGKTLGTDLKLVSRVSKSDLSDIDLLIVGSPVHVWRPSEATLAYLNTLTRGEVKGLRVAAFDTRLKGFFAGNAATKISSRLKRAGAKKVVPPIGFIVSGKKGPLVEGELEKAAAWAKEIEAHMGQNDR